MSNSDAPPKRGRPPGSGRPAWWAEARRLYNEEQMEPNAIAARLGKHRTSVYTALWAINRTVRNRNAKKYRRAQASADT